MPSPIIYRRFNKANECTKNQFSKRINVMTRNVGKIFINI